MGIGDAMGGEFVCDDGMADAAETTAMVVRCR
jgi:hypothetical protein